VSPQRPPRYDLPKAAPEPLRLVQLFLNTTDHEHGRELLGTPDQVRAWLEAHGLDATGVGRASAQRVRDARESVRRLLAAGEADDVLAESAHRARLLPDLGAARLVPQARGVDAALGTILATIYDAMRDGSWSRLKACRNCGWAYWDASRNRSAAWCSMQLCGNRLKVRRYRARSSNPLPRGVEPG
jgi:predicted RNA-binding Zn ribbon-like protein